jgi:hypothetical protein
MAKKKTFCPYCKNDAALVTGREVYPHRSDLHGRMFWMCSPCKAWVGCHVGSKGHKPLGRLANAELRILKQQAHAVFDPIWKHSRSISRKDAYAILADKLGIPVKECHIGYFDEERCRKVIQICKEEDFRG